MVLKRLGITKNKKLRLNEKEYVEGVLAGNRSILGKCISLIESSKKEDEVLALRVLNQIIPYSGKSLRIGISGVPGVGKSSFIEILGKQLIQKGHKVAVLAIDPSSHKTGGSILGDRTRMVNLSKDSSAFIRPSPSAETLGGVAQKTRETIFLCEAGGHDIILVETVGVGQSEFVVSKMVDFFLLLMLPGAGDSLQGIKRGILEIADLLVINKADGENQKKAKWAQREYENALHILRQADEFWRPEVLTCSSLEIKGFESIWNKIEEYFHVSKQNNYFDKKRREQQVSWMWELIETKLKNLVFKSAFLNQKLKDLEQEVGEGNKSATSASKEIISIIEKDLFKRT